MDQTGRSAEQEFAILGLNRRSKVLRNIEAALDRIEDGTFGVCSNCEEVIGQNRLTAVPWTPYCIRCQQAVDRGDAKNIEPSYELDINAA
jgi:DnaK suppressor protein